MARYLPDERANHKDILLLVGGPLAGRTLNINRAEITHRADGLYHDQPIFDLAHENGKHCTYKLTQFRIDRGMTGHVLLWTSLTESKLMSELINNYDKMSAEQQAAADMLDEYGHVEIANRLRKLHPVSVQPYKEKVEVQTSEIERPEGVEVEDLGADVEEFIEETVEEREEFEREMRSHVPNPRAG